MAEIVVMPKAGNSVESCIILEWSKQEGDAVQAGDILCEAETDKATVSVESTASGTVLKHLYKVDEDVPVMLPLAIVGEPGEDITALLAGIGNVAEQESSAPVETAPPSSAPAAASTQIAPIMQTDSEGPSGFASPRARNLAAAKAVALDKIQGTGPDGRIVERDVLSALDGMAPLTPSAMEELIRTGKTAPSRGTGLGGRVLKSDLVDAPSQTSASSAAAINAEFPGNVEDVKVKGVRKITASRMLESLTQTAQLTMNTSADATRLLALRKRLKESPDSMGLQGVTINDLVMLVTARTLKDFPEMNAHFLGDSIRQFTSVHMGCAVDTPRGLMVPVVRFADSLSLKEMGIETKRIFGKCLDGQADPEDLTGGTFTITNLGAMGIESFTPVLNKPEVGILGVCTIQPKPVMKGADVEFIPHMGLSLTFDHQATDGAPAGRFLKALVANLENIDLVLAL